MIKGQEYVALAADLPKHGLAAGDVDVAEVVHVYEAEKRQELPKTGA